MFEDARQERSLVKLLSLPEPDVIQQSKVTEFEMIIIKKLASEEVHRERLLKECVAVQILEQFSLF